MDASGMPAHDARRAQNPHNFLELVERFPERFGGFVQCVEPVVPFVKVGADRFLERLGASAGDVEGAGHAFVGRCARLPTFTTRSAFRHSRECDARVFRIRDLFGELANNSPRDRGAEFPWNRGLDSIQRFPDRKIFEVLSFRIFRHARETESIMVRYTL